MTQSKLWEKALIVYARTTKTAISGGQTTE